MLDEEGGTGALLALGDGSGGFKEAFAAREFDSHELAILVEAIESVAIHTRLNIDGRDALLGDILPFDFNTWLIGGQLEKEVLVVVTANVKVILPVDRRHDDGAVVCAVRGSPVGFASFRIESADLVGLRQDQLAFASGIDDDGRRVALFRSVAVAPDLFAGDLVVGDSVRPFTARNADELFAVDEWMAGVTPEGCLSFVELFEVLGPEDFSRGGFEAEEVPFGADGVNAVTFYRGRDTRSGGIGDGVFDGIFVLPDLFAGLFVEAEDALGAGEFFAGKVVGLYVVCRDVVRYEDAATGDSRTGIATSNLGSPEDLETAFWN